MSIPNTFPLYLLGPFAGKLMGFMFEILRKQPTLANPDNYK
jgi:hypothetical protein